MSRYEEYFLEGLKRLGIEGNLLEAIVKSHRACFPVMEGFGDYSSNGKKVTEEQKSSIINGLDDYSKEIYNSMTTWEKGQFIADMINSANNLGRTDLTGSWIDERIANSYKRKLERILKHKEKEENKKTTQRKTFDREKEILNAGSVSDRTYLYEYRPTGDLMLFVADNAENPENLLFAMKGGPDSVVQMVFKYLIDGGRLSDLIPLKDVKRRVKLKSGTVEKTVTVPDKSFMFRGFNGAAAASNAFHEVYASALTGNYTRITEVDKDLVVKLDQIRPTESDIAYYNMKCEMEKVKLAFGEYIETVKQYKQNTSERRKIFDKIVKDEKLNEREEDKLKEMIDTYIKKGRRSEERVAAGNKKNIEWLKELGNSYKKMLEEPDEQDNGTEQPEQPVTDKETSGESKIKRAFDKYINIVNRDNLDEDGQMELFDKIAEDENLDENETEELNDMISFYFDGK